MTAEDKILFERLENDKRAFERDKARFIEELHESKETIQQLLRLKAAHTRRRKHFNTLHKKLQRKHEELDGREKACMAREAALDERDRRSAQRQREQDLRDKSQNSRDSELIRKDEDVTIKLRQLQNERQTQGRVDRVSKEEQVGV